MRIILLIAGILLFGYFNGGLSDDPTNWKTDYDPLLMFTGILLMVTWSYVNTKALKKKYGK